MIEDKNAVRVGTVVVRDKEEFEVLDVTDIQVKAPNDANWHQAVMYKSLAAGDNIRRVRSLVDFCNKFDFPSDEEEE
jgi:hypothetical protein